MKKKLNLKLILKSNEWCIKKNWVWKIKKIIFFYVNELVFVLFLVMKLGRGVIIVVYNWVDFIRIYYLYINRYYFKYLG